jgi:glycosyltransferase involved in cell wall biosynthesis
MKNKSRKFVSIVWSYHKHMQDMATEESYHLHILKVAKECGLKPHIILKEGKEFLENDLNLDKDIVIDDYKNLFNFLFLIIKFSIQNSIFYVNSYEWQSFLVPFLARKTIFMAHTQPKRQSDFRQKIQNFVYRFFTAIRLNNISEEKFLLEQGISSEKMHIVPLVVSQDVFNLKNQDISTRKDLICFGNVTAKKDLITIVKAFEKVKNIQGDLKLNIIGNIFDDNVKEYVASSNYKSDIIFHGFLTNDLAVKKLNENLLYLNSSLDEGQCVAVYDAALCGLGLCLPNIMSFVDVYKDKAMFHDVYNYNKLAENILYYMNNRDIVKKHNQECIEMIKNDYSVEVVENKLKTLIKKL